MRITKSLITFIVFFCLCISMLYAQDGSKKTQTKTDTSSVDAVDADLKWHNPDYHGYSQVFDELARLSDAYSRNKLRQALSNYQTGKSTIEKMRKEVEYFMANADEERHLNEKWYWQVIDRQSRENNTITLMKRRAKIEAVKYFSKAIRDLDTITNRDIREGMELKELLARTYLEWVLAQYDLGNLPQCIDILERYIALGPRYELEVAPHKYLASAYAFKERVLEKYEAGTEQERLFYKKKKNEHLLRAAELKYKKDSPAYEQVVELINRDEVIAIAP